MAEGVLRTFVAIPLPDKAKQELQAVQERLQQAVGGRDVRWVNSAGLHLTLKFLGDTPSVKVTAVLSAIETATQGVPAFSLLLEGLGVFPNPRRPRVIWVGTSGQVDVLTRLQAHIEAKLAELGWPADARSFSAHITLGRVRDGAAVGFVERLQTALEAERGFHGGVEIPVREVVCYQSTLTPQGAVYARLGAVSLDY